MRRGTVEMGLDYDDVLELLALLEGSSVEYLEVEVGGTRLVASRSGALTDPGPTSISLTNSAPTGRSVVASSPPDPGRREVSAGSHASSEEVAEAPQPGSADAFERPVEDRTPPLEPAPGSIVVRAPMVGVFYRRPDPGSPPFVEIGSRVGAGDTMGLLEAMKMFTGVSAPHAGDVVAILVEDAQFVEFDQELFHLRPETA